jgi:hypothetical protein
MRKKQMTGNFAVLRHRQQDLIDRWLLAGKSVRWVASQTDPPVSFGAIQRYRKKLLTPALKRVASRLPVTANLPVVSSDGTKLVERPLHSVTGESLADERVNPFIQRTEQLWQESWNAIQEAKKAIATFTDAEGKEQIKGRDFSVLAPLINAAARSLELFGRGTGYMRDDAPAGQVQHYMVVLPRGLPQGPAMLRANDEMLGISPDKDVATRLLPEGEG